MGSACTALETQGNVDREAASAEGGMESGRSPHGAGEATRDQGVHRACDVIGEQQPELILRAPEGVVAPGHGGAELGQLGLDAVPRPEVPLPYGVGLVELQGTLVLARGGIRRAGRAAPECAPGEKHTAPLYVVLSLSG